MRNRLTLMTFTLAASLLAAASWAHGIKVESPWIRPAPAGVPMGGYMMLSNLSSRDRVLVGARSNAFNKIMAHRTVIENNMAEMHHLETLKLPAQSTVKFAPGGYHLMLMGATTPLAAGDSVAVELLFGNGESIKADFTVGAPD